MRKVVCTSSIFAAFIGLIVASILVKIPNGGSWPLFLNAEVEPTIPLILWFVGAVYWAATVGAVLFGLYEIWKLSAFCCEKLRSTPDEKEGM